MSREERTRIANKILSELRKLPYDGCCALMNETSNTAVKQDGKAFQAEIEAFWDDSNRQNVRVVVAVTDGGVSDFVPTTADFIIAPDGSFVGEDSAPKPQKAAGVPK